MNINNHIQSDDEQTVKRHKDAKTTQLFLRFHFCARLRWCAPTRCLARLPTTRLCASCLPGTRSTRDGAFDRELRQYAVRAKFVDDDARSRSVTRHVHCVRAVKLAFFKHCHSRYVLCRDEPGQGESVVERRTPAEFLALLENGEQRQKMCVSAKLALEKYLPLDRAFALYAPSVDQETHWFNERHALRLVELERSGELLDALKPSVARFRDDATRRTHSGRMNKMFGWMLALAGPRAPRSSRRLPSRCFGSGAATARSTASAIGSRRQTSWCRIRVQRKCGCESDVGRD